MTLSVRGLVLEVIRRLVERRGYVVLRSQSGFHYVPELYGQKHEKLADIRALPGFGDVAAEVLAAGRTYMGYARLYTLWQAARGAPPGDIAELGVYQGGSAHLLALAAHEFGREGQIHLFDTFGYFPDVRPEVDVTDRSGVLDTSEEAVRAYLRRFDQICFHVGEFPATASAVAGRRFGLVHVDSDTYSSYVAAFEFFAARLVPGGWLVLDDYGFTTCPGATRATDEFLARTDEFSFFSLLTGQALLIKKG